MSSEKNFSTMDTTPAAEMGTVTKTDLSGSIYDISERALIRRIDYRIVPLMFFCYLMQFLDKVIINVSSMPYTLWQICDCISADGKIKYANVMGLAKDAHLKGNEFSWMATAFFIAYAIAEIPQSMKSNFHFPPN